MSNDIAEQPEARIGIFIMHARHVSRHIVRKKLIEFVSRVVAHELGVERLSLVAAIGGDNRETSRKRRISRVAGVTERSCNAAVEGAAALEEQAAAPISRQGERKVYVIFHPVRSALTRSR
jgi:hypothetical protein